jgi:hypothetical protein
MLCASAVMPHHPFACPAPPKLALASQFGTAKMLALAHARKHASLYI